MIIFLSCIFGAIIGSFLNVLILRLPAEQSIAGRSHCAHCRHTLHAVDLVPIFSWLWLGGRCRYCRKPISSRYFWIELITAGLFGLCAWKFAGNGSSAVDILQLTRALFIIAVLIVVFMTDFEHFLILDNVVLPATLILMFLNFYVDVISVHYLGNSLLAIGLVSGLMLFCFFGILHFLSEGRWMGFGDVKFSFFLGLATPLPNLLSSLMLAFVLGAVVGIALILFKSKKLRSEIPFGTFLALGTAITLFYGPQIVDWYLRLAGLSYLAHY